HRIHARRYRLRRCHALGRGAAQRLVVRSFGNHALLERGGDFRPLCGDQGLCYGSPRSRMHWPGPGVADHQWGASRRREYANKALMSVLSGVRPKYHSCAALAAAALLLFAPARAQVPDGAANTTAPGAAAALAVAAPPSVFACSAPPEFSQLNYPLRH